MKNRPPYAIESVDNALHLAQLLLLEGPMRVTDAAEHLGVSPSTAHRLLAMLVYRDFAEQGADRRYRPGPTLGQAVAAGVPVGLLRRVALPHLQRLVDRVEESANLMVLTGAEVRFVATVECRQVLRVGDRAGKALPAHLTSAGNAMLAHSGPALVEEVAAGLDREEATRLRRALPAIRRNGFAINNERTETGLTAVGMAVRDADGTAIAGVSLALPSVRFRKARVAGWVEEISACIDAIERDLA